MKLPFLELVNYNSNQYHQPLYHPLIKGRDAFEKEPIFQHTHKEGAKDVLAIDIGNTFVF